MPTTFVASGQGFYNYGRLAHKHPKIHSLYRPWPSSTLPLVISDLAAMIIWFKLSYIMLVHITDPYIASFELSMYGRLCKYLHLEHDGDFISDISQHWNTTSTQEG